VGRRSPAVGPLRRAGLPGPPLHKNRAGAPGLGHALAAPPDAGRVPGARLPSGGSRRGDPAGGGAVARVA